MKAELDYSHTLANEVQAHGVSVIAERLGITRGAVSQMLNDGRTVYLKKMRGQWCYAEIKPYKHARVFLKKRRPIARRRHLPPNRGAARAQARA